MRSIASRRIAADPHGRSLQQLERDPDRGEAHARPRPMSPNRTSRATVVAPAAAQANQTRPTGFSRRAAVRSGDARDADCDVGARGFERTLRHRPRRRLADRPVRPNRLGRNAQQILFGLVGIDHEAALDHRGRPGDFRQEPRDEAAGAGFRGCDLECRGAESIEQRCGAERSDRVETWRRSAVANLLKQRTHCSRERRWKPGAVRSRLDRQRSGEQGRPSRPDPGPRRSASLPVPPAPANVEAPPPLEYSMSAHKPDPSLSTNCAPIWSRSSRKSGRGATIPSKRSGR